MINTNYNKFTMKKLSRGRWPRRREYTILDRLFHLQLYA